MSITPGSTLDHHVPRMYLRRFAISRGSRHRIAAADVHDLSRRFDTDVRRVAAERGFYWGTDREGVPHHEMEEYLRDLESAATPAFRRVLDQGHSAFDDALPSWPPRPEVREALSWWIAAQILRTVRQRERLSLDEDCSIAPPPSLAKANRHIAYINELIAPLAGVIHNRPWGVGFSDHCLVTGDVPVLVLNGQDEDDQLLAADFWDIYLPLDPHRCLYLPGRPNRRTRELSIDHRLKLHPGHGIALNNAMAETAMKHIFFHPQHDPMKHLSPRERSGEEAEMGSSWMPRYLFNYGLVPSGFKVERKWLIAHPDSTDEPDDADRLADAEVVDHATNMIGHLDNSSEVFDALRSTTLLE
ncbi:DUF4238 domain-containing protein [Rhodococcus erythropolis]